VRYSLKVGRDLRQAMTFGRSTTSSWTPSLVDPNAQSSPVLESQAGPPDHFGQGAVPTA